MYIRSFALMTFTEYLKDKKIDPDLFKSNEPEQWNEWATLFEQMGPASFTGQKLYLINPLRRKYRLTLTETSSPPTARAKPVFKPKITP